MNMYIDIQTDHGKHLHIEFHYVSALVMWLKRHNLMHGSESAKHTESLQHYEQKSFHADQAYHSRHYRGPLGPQ